MGRIRLPRSHVWQIWRGSQPSALLSSPAFVAAVALLLLNDWVLKSAAGNWWTGKLSDLAGLFAFSLFWTALFPTRRDAVFALTAVGFLFWKSPLSEAPLAEWNALGLWRLGRTVDYTDWIALVALLPAYRLARGRRPPRAPIRPSRLPRRIVAVVAAGIALAAFTATSRLPPSYELRDPTHYSIPATGTEVRTGLQYLGLNVGYLHPWATRAARRHATAADSVRLGVDTLIVHIRQPPERMVGVTVEVSEVTPSDVRLRLLAASAYGPEPSSESIHRAFRKQVLEPLHEWLARHRTSRD